MYGHNMLPTLAIMELEPIPEFRTKVGNSSADQTYIMANAAETPNFPTLDRTSVIQYKAETEKMVDN